jgi:hypothetical protein
LKARPTDTGTEVMRDFDPGRPLASFARTVGAVLLSPGAFFPRMRRDAGFLPPFLFMTICLGAHVAAVWLLRTDLVLVERNLAMGLLFPFLTAAILHLVLTRIFRAGGAYQVAFRVNAYAAAVNVFSWIPMAGMLLELYRVYLLAVGLAAAYRTKTSHAFGAIAITLLIYMAAAGAARQWGISLS